MKLLVLSLTGIYMGFSLVGTWMVISNNLPMYLIPFALVFVVVALALNSKGGRFVKLSAYFISGLLSLFLLIVIAMGISLFYNNEYDWVSPIIFTALGFIGYLSIYALRKLDSLQ